MYEIRQVDGSVIKLRDVQLTSLGILEDFHNFCEKYDLKYTLCGGCCIGSLRNNGFIPWDDDVDVHMLRSDYDRFYKLWKKFGNREKYTLVKTTKDEFQDTMLTQISLNNTTFIKSNLVESDINHGIKLEIIPLDGAPVNKIKRRIQLIWAHIFTLFNRGFIPQNRGKVVAYVSKLILRIFSTSDKRYPIWSFAEKRMTKYSVSESKYLTELYVTGKYMKIMYPKEIFEDRRLQKFENGYYYIPLYAEKYLEMAFGDYMSLPPKSSRIPKHDTIYIDLDRSYLEYKGVYYLNESKNYSAKS